MEALFARVDEEAGELAAAPPDDRLEEAADVHEVLTALDAPKGLSLVDVAEAADHMRTARGGVNGRWWPVA